MKTKIILFHIALFAAVVGCANSKNDQSDNETTTIPSSQTASIDTATFAGGCFWCTEAVFERVQGVVDVVSGYSGGKKENADYRKVSHGFTEHAEAVQIYFDPDEISYETLTEIFFATHDPTQLNRQGPDVGKQYRSAVFYHNQKQRKIVEDHIAYLNESGKYTEKIVTQVNEYEAFYIAEDFHQDYYELNPYQPYILNVAKPKVEKLKKQFRDLLKKKYRS